MQLERVGSVAVGRLLLEVFRQVDDLYGAERALLDADAASDAQVLGDVRHLRGTRHLDAHLANLHHRARLLALLLALLRPAPVRGDDGDAGERVPGVLRRVLSLLAHLVFRVLVSFPPKERGDDTRAVRYTRAGLLCGKGRVNVPQEKPWRLTRICCDPIIDLEIMTGFHLVCVSNGIRFPVVVR